MSNGKSLVVNSERGPRREDLVSVYLTMKEHVVRMGYSEEIDWQDARSISSVSEREFLAEGAWVILSSGMRESVIARRYPQVSKAFKDWSSAQLIVANRRECERQALLAFNNIAKISAIGSLCETVNASGYHRVLARIQAEGVDHLMNFDYIGPVTSYHFAKNIGLDVVKPDRHLARMAAGAGYLCPEELCRDIAEVTGDKLSVIDVVLWRYATLDSLYMALIT